MSFIFWTLIQFAKLIVPYRCCFYIGECHHQVIAHTGQTRRGEQNNVPCSPIDDKLRPVYQ